MAGFQVATEDSHFDWKNYMKPIYKTGFCFLAAVSIFTIPATAQECSTEKVNHADCTVTIDRYYPLGPPTIQMAKRKKVTIQLQRGLPFESASLDLQSAQAVAGTDQTAALVTAALAQAKSLVFQVPLAGAAGVPPPPVPANIVADNITALDSAITLLRQGIGDFGQRAVRIYEELQEVVGTIPPQTLVTGARIPASPLSPGDTPRPWDQFTYWRAWMLCEIGGSMCPDDQRRRPIRGLLGSAADLTVGLSDLGAGNCPDANKTTNYDCKIKKIYADIDRLAPGDRAALQQRMRGVESDYGALTADAAGLAAVAKDLGSYFVNIEQLADSVRESHHMPAPTVLGDIVDPASTNSASPIIARLFGRQVVFAVNVVNGVAQLLPSVPPVAQKKTIATITVLYADPILEPSAGAFFSMLPNRSFANQTLVTVGNPPTLGNIVITQTAAAPTVVPFAAANWRLGPDFLIGRRRAAIYLTGAIGINPYSTSTEFGLGPTLSWRLLMFSAFYHLGRDLRLTQGEEVGMVWCNGNPNAATKCSPPAPTTERYWKGAFAVGISVRIPAVFAASSATSTTSK
jgi:hypothetical protein